MESLIGDGCPGPRLFLPGRRDFLKASALAGMGGLTSVSQLLAAQAEGKRGPARSIILVWLSGGPSQFDTFDPKPGTPNGGRTKGRPTPLKNVQIADGFEQLADQMGKVTLVRSIVSKEGDHERGTFLLKTGYRPEPTIEHASIGAICCHELPSGNTGIPRHISILPSQWPARGGYLGGEYDAFQVHDPQGKLPDVSAAVEKARNEARLADLDVVERAFARGRGRRVDATLHRDTVSRARVMMTTEQLKAFDVASEPKAIRDEYGNTAARSRLLGRAAVDRSRRPLHRDQPRRLGQPRQQSRNPPLPRAGA